MYPKHFTPRLAVIGDRDAWVFPNGKVLPVIAGGDHSADPAEVRTLLDLQRAKRTELDDGVVGRATEAILLASSENRGLTAEETELVQRAAEVSREIDSTIADTVQLMRGNATANVDLRDLAPRGIGGAIVRTEPTTYGASRRESDHCGNSFIKDHARIALGLSGAASARERLDRHAREVEVEQRAGSTGDTAGGTFVPPLWVLNEFVGVTRAGRVAADLARQMGLPAGTDSINIPTITTGTVTDIQSSENSAATTRDIVTSSTTADVTTIAGTEDFSLQLLEQSPLAGGWDQLVFTDLMKDYNRRLDVNVLSGSGSSNQNWGISTIAGTSVTVSTAAATAIYAGLGDALSRMSTTRYEMGDVILMHPRRWFWMASRMDTTGRPVIVPDPQAGQNLLAAMGITAAQGVVGTMFGLPVAIDANITTTGSTYWDEIYVWKASDAILMEGTPRFEVFRTIGGATTDPLTARARLYNYAAFTTRYSTGVATVTGAGLTGPTF